MPFEHSEQVRPWMSEIPANEPLVDVPAAIADCELDILRNLSDGAIALLRVLHLVRRGVRHLSDVSSSFLLCQRSVSFFKFALSTHQQGSYGTGSKIQHLCNFFITKPGMAQDQEL